MAMAWFVGPNSDPGVRQAYHRSSKSSSVQKWVSLRDAEKKEEVNEADF
jgi:hypothetical protein